MQKILVIKHSAFGDFVQGLGVMKAIRAHHRGAHITLLTTQPFVALAQASGYFDDVRVDARPKWHQLSKLAGLWRFFNRGRFDRVYDLQNNDRTGLYFRMFGRKPEWNGIVAGATHRLADDAARRKMHAFNALRAQVAVAGFGPVAYDTLDWIKADISGFELRRPYALLAAGCSPKHPRKRWPVERYIEVCQWLSGRGVVPVLLGTADEGTVNAQIAAACPRAMDLTGRTTLFHIPALARGAALALGNDTGPMQMIGPTGCKSLVLFPGFTKPWRHGPLGENVRTLQGEDIADISVDAVKTVLETYLT